MEKTKVYLSGQMAGLCGHNYKAFEEAARILRAAGYTVYSPAEYDWDQTQEFPRTKAFQYYTELILDVVDLIVLLPGHELSNGVAVEKALGKMAGIPLVEYKDLKKSIEVTLSI